MEYELTHARHDRIHCLAPGLFRSLKKGQRNKEKLNITYTHGKYEVQFVCFEPLAADDLRFLQGLAAMAGPGRINLPPFPTDVALIHLRGLLNAKGEGASMDGIFIQGKIGRLLTEIGMSDGGENIRSFKSSLKRLANVTIFLARDDKSASFNLLSYSFDHDTGEFNVALNPRLTQAVVGGRSHTRIEMSEVRRLRGDVARLIHQRICGYTNPGREHRISIEALSSYAWPTDAQTSSAVRQRNSRVRKAIVEIKGCGWDVTEYARDKFLFRRPQKPLPEGNTVGTVTDTVVSVTSAVGTVAVPIP